jgi:hypothetical protein
MMYKTKVAVCSEIRTQHSKSKTNTLQNFLMLSRAVRKETARL